MIAFNPSKGMVSMHKNSIIITADSIMPAAIEIALAADGGCRG